MTSHKLNDYERGLLFSSIFIKSLYCILKCTFVRTIHLNNKTTKFLIKRIKSIRSFVHLSSEIFSFIFFDCTAKSTCYVTISTKLISKINWIASMFMQMSKLPMQFISFQIILQISSSSAWIVNRRSIFLHQTFFLYKSIE